MYSQACLDLYRMQMNVLEGSLEGVRNRRSAQTLQRWAVSKLWFWSPVGPAGGSPRLPWGGGQQLEWWGVCSPGHRLGHPTHVLGSHDDCT